VAGVSELVTGEAVALELRPAKLPSRALAVLIDLVVAFVAYIVVSLVVVAATASLDDAAAAALAVSLFLLVLVGGPIAVETLSHGRSLGKLACGLRVVRDDGGPIRFRHALVRGAVGVVEILMTLGVVACIASLVSARGRRVGDVFAGTLVVRERVPAGQASYVPAPPPWLAGRFTELDLSAVPEALWLAVRQYLTRMGQLDPQIGWSMAERLAADVAACTGASVPPGVPPAAFLAAVVHERQTREAQRTFGAGPAAYPAPYAAPGYPTPGAYPAPASHPSGPGAYGVPAGPATPAGPTAPATPGSYNDGASAASWPAPVAPPARDGAGEPEPPTTGFAPPA
jgi:uncharacterized RDD family membrane protein YckC